MHMMTCQVLMLGQNTRGVTNTRNLLRRKNKVLDDLLLCVMKFWLWRNQFSPFLWMCFFSQSCWNTIPITWNLNSQPLYMIIEARTTFGSPLFREIFITACCVIWSTRNGVIFDSGQINLNVWKTQFREVGLQELGLVCTKAKQSR